MVMTPMAMVMMSKAVAVTEMAVPVPVPVTVAMAMAMTMTTTGGSRGRNGEGCRRERESAEDGRDDLLHANHGGLLVRSAGIALPCCKPSEALCGRM